MGRDRDSYVMLCSLCKQLACTDFHCVYSWDCASHFFTFLAPSVCRSMRCAIFFQAWASPGSTISMAAMMASWMIEVATWSTPESGTLCICRRGPELNGRHHCGITWASHHHRCLVWASMMSSSKLRCTICVRHLSRKSALDTKAKNFTFKVAV